MYKLINNPVTRKITAQEAEAFLALNNFPGQRDLLELKARRYSELLDQGRLRPVEIAFATCPDKNRYLMNGQHVCQGCVWSGKEMHATVSHYRCETWTDAWYLFSSFDVHSSRTQGQIFKAARGQFGNDELKSVALRTLSTCGSALAAMDGNKVSFARCTATADKTTKPALVNEHALDVLWVNQFSDSSRLMRVGAVCAMIATHRANPAKADLFWSKIHSGLGFKSKSDPEKKVFDYLLKPPQTQMNSRSHHESVYATCICWWNSFVSGEPRVSVKFGAMTELPKVKS